MDRNVEHIKRNFQSDDKIDQFEAKKRKLDSEYKLISVEENTESKYDKIDSITEKEWENETSVQEVCKGENYEIKERNANLDCLSDDILLILLSYLNSSDLFNLSLCSRHFFNICRDKTLWYKVFAICDGKWPSHALLPSYFNHGTKYLHFLKKKKSSINDPEDICFGNNFFPSLRSVSNLKTFILQNHVISTKTFKLKYLPESITELRLPGTQLIDVPLDTYTHPGFFSKVNVFLPNLEIVDVSYCQWFHPHVLLPLAKCSKLKMLILIGCRQMKDFIPYASLAAAFGYQNLETLDMRLTDVVDREIGCFNKIKSLKHIFLEKPNDLHSYGESITDICTTSLGMRNWHSHVPGNMVLICRIPEDGGTFVDHTLETLVVRNYPKITDITLKHAEKCLKSLKYLDVTGCSCTAAQIAIFKKNRPEVKLLCSDAVA